MGFFEMHAIYNYNSGLLHVEGISKSDCNYKIHTSNDFNVLETNNGKE